MSWNFKNFSIWTSKLFLNLNFNFEIIKIPALFSINSSKWQHTSKLLLLLHSLVEKHFSIQLVWYWKSIRAWIMFTYCSQQRWRKAFFNYAPNIFYRSRLSNNRRLIIIAEHHKNCILSTDNLIWIYSRFFLSILQSQQNYLSIFFNVSLNRF